MSAVGVAPDQTKPGARICASGGFLGVQHDRNEQATWMVVAITVLAMVGEILGGTIFGSMAVVADGWHMCTDAAALTIAAMAYRYARMHAEDSRFAFGTGKVGELAGFASAVVLGVVSLLIGWESIHRLLSPRPIQFSQATVVAVLGLVVNLASAWLLHRGGHDHAHGHGHDHDHDHHAHAQSDGHAEAGHDRHAHRDNNQRAAYQHLVADVLTSVLAIVGLLAGQYLGWVWLDPVVGVIGAGVIAAWSVSLIRTAGCSLLDVRADGKLAHAVRQRLESPADTVHDLHLWRLGPGHQGLIVSILSTAPASPEVYKQRLAGLDGLSHVTVEVNPAP
jgi:cation diffusion facilitator family transporter